MLKNIQKIIQNSGVNQGLFQQFQYQQGSIQSLVQKQAANYNRVAPGKKMKKRIKYCEARPHLFKKVSKIRPMDLKQENIVFPINIPVKFSYIYRPQKYKPRYQTHDYINFKNMSGNQILLHLEEPNNLRETEICSALIELSKREIKEEIDWNQHEWIQNTLDHLLNHLDSFSPASVSYVTLGLFRLKINRQEIWDKLEHVVAKTMHKFTAKGFGYVYISFLEANQGTQEFKETLASRLPIHIHKMNQQLIAKCFEQTVENKLMNDHLFDNHFHILFWRRLQWFGAQYPTIINGMVQMQYKDDKEFWEDSFLPAIRKIKFQDEEQISELLSSLQNLEMSLGIKVEQYVKYLEEQLEYIQTQGKALENAKFYNIVMNDIAYYQQKQSLQQQQ